MTPNSVEAQSSRKVGFAPKSVIASDKRVEPQKRQSLLGRLMERFRGKRSCQSNLRRKLSCPTETGANAD